VFTLIGLLAFVLIVLVPFWWIASMSFKTYEQIQFATSIYIPRPFTWENYAGLWAETRFPLWLRNSLVTAVVVTLITTVVASLSGYAVARLRFPGREAVASLILILYLVPPALLFIPLYRVLGELPLPGVPELRKPVDEHHEGAVALGGVVEALAVHVRVVMRGHGNLLLRGVEGHGGMIRHPSPPGGGACAPSPSPSPPPAPPPSSGG
jgi:ABC-type spermidine/putrescine transport system permease subunit II